ncbi:MAG: right-handed parallel beta-helix repeat-containing protein [Pseudonocardia sp.]
MSGPTVAALLRAAGALGVAALVLVATPGLTDPAGGAAEHGAGSAAAVPPWASVAFAAPTPGANPDPGPETSTEPGAQPAPEPPADPGPDPAPAPDPTAPPSTAPVPAPPTTEPAPGDEARRKAAEQARKRAAEQARKQAEAAAKAAARRAADEREARDTWLRHGSPHRMVVVRPSGADVVSDGRLGVQRAIGATVTPEALSRITPPGWIQIAPDAMLISAAIVLTPGTELDLTGAPRIALAGGDALADASSVYTGGGRLLARGVTVESVRAGTGEPMAPGPGRPFVVVAGGGRLDALDATFRGLGTHPDDPAGRGGVQFNPGATGSLVGTTLVGNTIGLELSGTRDVTLERVTVAESAADGLVLQGDRGTVLREVRAERNGANGVLVKGPSSDRPITGISTTGNAGFGLAVVGQTAPQILGVTTAADLTGGLRINRSTNALVADFTAIDQPLAVFTHVGTADAVLQRARITGGRRGLVIEKSTRGLAFEDSTVDGAKVVGISSGGKAVSVTRVTVTDSGTALRVERGAVGFAVTGVRIVGGEDGIVANPGSSHVVLDDVRTDGVANDAVRTLSSGATLQDVRITDSETGIVTQAATTLTDVAVSAADVGLRARGPEPVVIRRAALAAFDVGIDAGPAAHVELRDSRVHAIESLRGDVTLVGVNDVSLPPLNLIAAIGLPLIGIAVLLELVHSLRQRRFKPRPRRTPPVPVGAA